jgi:hypothetical protein
MIALNSKLKMVRNVLTAVCKKVYHYRRPASIDGCVIWQEDSEEGSFNADNAKSEQVIHGTIDYFTSKEYDQTIDDIQCGLASNRRISWRIYAILYEDETALIHYQWEFWVM